VQQRHAAPSLYSNLLLAAIAAAEGRARLVLY
jgi:hypothetical protein